VVEKRETNSFALRLAIGKENTVMSSTSTLRPLNRKALHNIVDKTSAASKKSKTQTIPEITSVGPSIEVPKTPPEAIIWLIMR